MTITIPPVLINTDREIWCLYEHWIGNDRIYVGNCKLVDIILAPDARKSEQWRELTTDQPVTIVIVSQGKRNEIYRQGYEYLGSLLKQGATPICNGPNKPTYYVKTGRIECSDGRIFLTQLDAARGLGVDQSRVSKHLNGKPGFGHIKGLTLKRGR